MRGSLLAMILVSACYTPSVPSEVPCSPSGECPDNQMCVAGTCRVDLPPDASTSSDSGLPQGASDRDRDGVADSADNCPDIGNANQFNEDGDSRGDACDLCPLVSSPSDSDADSDKIGDACDPNPAGKDTSWLIETFRAGQPSWPGSANWAAVGSAAAAKLQVTAGGNTGDNGEYLILPLTAAGRTYDNVLVSATITVSATMGGDGFHDVGVSIDDDTAMKSLWCELERGSSANDTRLGLGDDNGVTQRPVFAWVPNVEYRLTLARHGTSYTCTVVGPDGRSVSASATSNIVPRSGGAFTIGGFGVTAQFGAISVVGP